MQPKSGAGADDPQAPYLPLLDIDRESGPATIEHISEFQARLYAELVVLGAIVVRGWADMLARMMDLYFDPGPGGITRTGGGYRSDPENVAGVEPVTLIRWKDSAFADRTLTLGSYLHQYDFSFHDNLDSSSATSRTANDDAYGHPGFGYLVSHNQQNGESPLGKGTAPARVRTLIFSGGHHAVHRIEQDYPAGAGVAIPVIIQWFVATGRDHPIWSAMWDMPNAQKPPSIDFDMLKMDVRAPYGSLNFDGAHDKNGGYAIGGVAWGDSTWRFTTTGERDAQLTLNSHWTYNTPNRVNFVRAWTADTSDEIRIETNAEMGIVQTRPSDKQMGYPDRVLTAERGHTSADSFSNCSAWGGDDRHYLMPCVAGWPYQMMNYDWDPAGGKPADEATGTKLLAWGSPYGWLGASAFRLFDDSGATGDGRGQRSYATFIVLGPKGRWKNGQFDAPGDVDLAIAEVEALAAASLSVEAPGTLVSQALIGPEASEMKNIVNGYDDTYAAYRIAAVDDRVTFTFTPVSGKAVRNPIFVIQGYRPTRLPTISVNGKPVPVNAGSASGAFMSNNAAARELWVTLHATVSQATLVRIEDGAW
jgi:hypothetical protein